MASRVRLAEFDRTVGLNRDRGSLTEAVWYAAKILFFLTAIPYPSKFKCWILRSFGAKVGTGVVIKPRVNIHMPWKLEIGNDVWIGEEAFVLNFEQVQIGNNVVISQRAFLCCGNHDFRVPSMPYRNEPITLEEGCWVGAGCFIGPGVSVGVDTVIGAGCMVTASVPENSVLMAAPLQTKGVRWRSDDDKSPY